VRGNQGQRPQYRYFMEGKKQKKRNAKTDIKHIIELTGKIGTEPDGTALKEDREGETESVQRKNFEVKGRQGGATLHGCET